MMEKRFWEVFYDRDNSQFEVVRISQDDTHFTLRICDLQKAGKHVDCSTIPTNVSKEDIIADMNSQGYQHVDGLYERAIARLHTK